MKLYDTESLAWYLLRNLHGDSDEEMNYDDVVAVLNGYANAVEDRLMQTVPVIETNLEVATDKALKCIEWMTWLIEETGKKVEDAGYDTSDIASLRTPATNREYIAVFLDRLNDHIEAAKKHHDLN